METIHQGIELAEVDLKLRGPGNLFGTEQSGIIDLKIASLTDSRLINQTHTEAVKLIGSLNKYPDLWQYIQEVLEKTRKGD